MFLSAINAEFDNKYINEVLRIRKLKIDQYYEDYHLIKINQFFDFHAVFNVSLKYKSVSLSTHYKELFKLLKE